MQYRQDEAKDYARAHFKGIWAAALTPFTPDLASTRRALGTTSALGGRPRDRRRVRRRQAGRVLLDVGRRAQADVRHRGRGGAGRSSDDPVLLGSEPRRGDRARPACAERSVPITSSCMRRCCISCNKQDETLYRYYQTIGEQVDIAIALWSHPDSGYLMSPELCARLAEIPNVVAIKYSVPREMYARLTRLAGDRILVSTASEEEWLDNIVELGWQLYLCSSPPYLLQTKSDRRIRDYTDLALRGEVARARAVRDSLDPVREAFRRTRPAEKFHSHSKVLAGAAGPGGRGVRLPMLELSEAEKDGLPARVRGQRARPTDCARQRRSFRNHADRRRPMPTKDDCTPSISRTGSTSTSTCSSRRSATRRCSRTAR